MSVIIKGMKKSASCISCPLQFGGFCGASPAWVEGRVAPTVEEAAVQKYPKWCPMVDTDELRNEIASWHETEPPTYVPNYDAWERCINVIDEYLAEVQDAEGRS